MTRLIALALLLLLPAAAQAQAVRDTHDEQMWINVTGFGEIGDITLFAEIQPRIGGGISRLDQSMIRTAAGVKLTGRLSILQGYARVRTPVEGRADTTEDRSFQQINWTLGGGVSSRTRLEQRWVSTGGDTGWRLRQLVRFVQPLGERRPGRRPGVAALVHAEGFFALNDTDWGARAGFDRLRSFAGAEVPIGGKSTVEIGYMNQLINQARRGDTMDHIASISLFLRP